MVAGTGTAADGGSYMTIGDYFAISDNLTHAMYVRMDVYRRGHTAHHSVFFDTCCIGILSI